MDVYTNEYATVVRGTIERSVANERRAVGAERDAIVSHVEAFLAGKLKAARLVRLCEIDPHSLEIMDHREGGIDPKNPARRRMEHRPVKLEMKHVAAAKLHTRDRLTLLDRDENDNELEPFVSVLFKDGSRIELPFDNDDAEAAETKGANPLQHPMMKWNDERLRVMANKLGVPKWQGLTRDELLEAIALATAPPDDGLDGLSKAELLALATGKVKPPTGKNLETLNKQQLVDALRELGVTAAKAGAKS